MLGSGTGMGPKCASENQPWTLGNYQKESCSLLAEGLSGEGISQLPSIFAKEKAKCKAKLNNAGGVPGSSFT